MAAGLALVAGLLLTAVAARAAPDEAARKAEIKAAWQAASEVAVAGPRQVPLLDQATLALPEGYVFIPAKEADRVMTALGNSSDDDRLGLIMSRDDTSQWLVEVDWVKEGYVRDGDAKEWQPDAMLESIKEGNEEGNKDREARGFAALDIIGWVQEPHYDANRNQLVWSLAARERGAPAGQPQTINYNTYALGREGYISMNLITGSDTIAADKPAVHALLANLRFTSGKRYADFNASTDKVAAYGLAGLVGAVAIKKLGLLAAIGVFLLKVWKLGLLVVLGGWAALKKWVGRLFGRTSQAEEEPGDWAGAADGPDHAAIEHGQAAVDAPEPSIEPAGDHDASPSGGTAVG